MNPREIPVNDSKNTPAKNIELSEFNNHHHEQKVIADVKKFWILQYDHPYEKQKIVFNIQHLYLQKKMSSISLGRDQNNTFIKNWKDVLAEIKLLSEQPEKFELYPGHIILNTMHDALIEYHKSKDTDLDDLQERFIVNIITVSNSMTAVLGRILQRAVAKFVYEDKRQHLSITLPQDSFLIKLFKEHKPHELKSELKKAINNLEIIEKKAESYFSDLCNIPFNDNNLLSAIEQIKEIVADIGKNGENVGSLKCYNLATKIYDISVANSRNYFLLFKTMDDEISHFDENELKKSNGEEIFKSLIQKISERLSVNTNKITHPFARYFFIYGILLKLLFLANKYDKQDEVKIKICNLILDCYKNEANLDMKENILLFNWVFDQLKNNKVVKNDINLWNRLLEIIITQSLSAETLIESLFSKISDLHETAKELSQDHQKSVMDAAITAILATNENVRRIYLYKNLPTLLSMSKAIGTAATENIIKSVLMCLRHEPLTEDTSAIFFSVMDTIIPEILRGNNIDLCKEAILLFTERLNNANRELFRDEIFKKLKELAKSLCSKTVPNKDKECKSSENLKIFQERTFQLINKCLEERFELFCVMRVSMASSDISKIYAKQLAADLKELSDLFNEIYGNKNNNAEPFSSRNILLDLATSESKILRVLAVRQFLLSKEYEKDPFIHCKDERYANAFLSFIDYSVKTGDMLKESLQCVAVLLLQVDYKEETRIKSCIGEMMNELKTYPEEGVRVCADYYRSLTNYESEKPLTFPVTDNASQKKTNNATSLADKKSEYVLDGEEVFNPNFLPIELKDVGELMMFQPKAQKIENLQTSVSASDPGDAKESVNQAAARHGLARLGLA